MSLSKIKAQTTDPLSIFVYLKILWANTRRNGPLQLFFYLSNLDFVRFVEYSKALEFISNAPVGYVLDIGSGYSTFSKIFQSSLKNPATHYICLDLSKGACKYQAEAKLPNIHEIRCDMRYLPIKSSSVTSVMAISSIEHVPSDTLVFQDVGRVLKVNGLAIISLPHSPKETRTVELKHDKWLLSLLRNHYGLWLMLLNKHLAYFIEQTETDSLLKYYSDDFLNSLAKKSGMEIETRYYFGNILIRGFRHIPHGWFVLKDFLLGFILAKIDEKRGCTSMNSKVIIFLARKNSGH